MKMFGLVVSALLLLSAPAIAVEFKGQNIDGQKLRAKAYYYATGGVYKVEVIFNKQQATIFFEDGNTITIQLNSPVITDSNNIEGSGKLGQYRLTNGLSVGLVYDNNWPNSSGSQLQQSDALEGLWRISLD